MNAKIVIASTLKPVIDPRAFEKIGKSLASSGKYDVSIIGSSPTTVQTTQGITLHPFKYNRGNNLQRLLLPWKIFIKIRNIKPDLLLVSTHELLFMAVIYKLFSRSIIIYDIRENYYFNLLYQSNYVSGLKQLMARYVRAKELILSNFIDHFLLAEKCYVDEINFIGNRYTVIENKYKPSDQPLIKLRQEKIEFLMSGTISKEYGVFEAINFIRQFDSSKFRLIIIGHCPNKKLYQQLIKETKDIENIDLIISSQPIPQSDIINKISQQTIGLLPYQINKSTKNKVPTKLYEYIGLGIPILISPNPTWQNIVVEHSAGLSVNFNNPVSTSLKNKIYQLTHVDYIPDLKNIIWKTEEEKIYKLFEKKILANKPLDT